MTLVDVVILGILTSIFISEYKWYRKAEEWGLSNDTEFANASKEKNEHLEKFTKMKSVTIALRIQNSIIAMSATAIAIVIFVTSL